MKKKSNVLDSIVYAVRLKDKEALMKSSSGGAFTAISDVFLNRGDAVVCSVYNYEKHRTEFRLFTEKENRDEARGSKYMQSRPGEIFSECVKWLRKNPEKSILFVGTGCQADGFRKYVETIGLRERTFIVDIICHGVPSPKIWREYVCSLERKFQGVSSNLTFKDKRKGWKQPTAVVTINRKEVSLKEYVKVFYNQCALRPSCHECPYATTERKTDMTIGDFWHIEEKIPDFYDYAGNSLILIHTNRGIELFDEIKEALDYRLSNTKECWQKNLEYPTPMSAQRAIFWKDYKNNGVDYIMNKYGTVSLGVRVMNKIKKIVRGGVHARK